MCCVHSVKNRDTHVFGDSTLVRPWPLAGAYILYPQATHNWGAHTTTRSEAGRTLHAITAHSGARAVPPSCACTGPCYADRCLRLTAASPKLREGARLVLSVRRRVGEPGAVLRAGRVCQGPTDRRVRRRAGGRSSRARMRVIRHREGMRGPGRRL